MDTQPTTQKEKPAPAEPTNLAITDEDRNEADIIIGDSSKYFIQYIRETHRIAVERDKDGNFVSRKIVRGAPIAALVAVCQKDADEGTNAVAVGWSKRHTGIIEDDDGNKVGNIEPLPFTKDSARRCAILRALVDGIVFKEGSSSVRTEDGNHVPNAIARNMPYFMERVERYFGEDCEVYNVKQ